MGSFIGSFIKRRRVKLLSKMVSDSDLRIPEILVTTTYLDSEQDSIPSILVTSYFSVEEADHPVPVDRGYLYPPDVYQLAESTHPQNQAVVNRFIQERLDNLDGYSSKTRSCDCECSQDLFRSIEESVQCPVCLDSPRGYIFQCEFGHVMCSSCRNRLRSCPVCRVKLVFPIRNLALEKLATMLYKK